MKTLALRKKHLQRMLSELEAKPPKSQDGKKLLEVQLRMLKKQLNDVEQQLTEAQAHDRS